ncbi:RNA polymerase sigma factor [Brevibacillus fortis]|uniref:RNA polymerase n=1 Tax=Brevibacillus fortis TaxID=2126352 RepID=A0A2P7UYU5_9BACL|nr:sigma-70 family RNA polymerase sigma factor [Brevibacillus fortis]PSJ92150.1 RNA polymerase [Brevibacillus fortis]
MEKKEIELLLQAIKNGSLEQFEIIIDYYQQPIFTYCYHMLSHHHEAEMAVQEVLLHAYEHLEQYTTALSFSTWLYRIAHNYCANELKRRKLNRWLPFLYKQDHGGIVKEHIDRPNREEHLERIWNRLAAEERSLVFWRVLEEKEYEEIAELLDKPPEVLHKQFERILKKCKRYLPTMEGVAANGQKSV